VYVTGTSVTGYQTSDPDPDCSEIWLWLL